MMSRIKTVFSKLQQEGRKGLIPFVTAGDPEPEITVALLHALADAGSDVIELGIPFSDPMADGPVIQRSSERALSKGVTTRKVLAYVSEFRQLNQHTPIVLMGYANPIERMGINHFVTEAQKAGIDGVLVVDYPPEESLEFSTCLRAVDLDPIFLLSPTSSDERIAKVAEMASGYLYYVSLKGVTGAKNLNEAEVCSKLPMISHYTHLPVAVGFGICDAQSACRVAQSADAVVIGSALIQALEAGNPAEAAILAGNFIAPIRAALDSQFSNK